MDKLQEFTETQNIINGKKVLVGKVIEWLDGFLEYSPLIEYQVSEEEKIEVYKDFIDFIKREY